MSVADTVVHCGRLIDGTGRAPLGPATLVLRGDCVGEVLAGPPPQALRESGATLIEASDATVMPGMMDLHVHLVHSVHDPREPHITWGLLSTSSQLRTLWAASRARLLLEAGFTTIRDVASFISPRNPEVLALRDAVELGLVPGPRVVAAGWVGPTAGHGDMGVPRSWHREPGRTADGPWAVRQMVRELAREAVDLVKTATSGGAGGHGEEMWWRNWSDEELGALVDEARGFGLRVASHSHTAESVKRAARAGVATVEHGVFLDDEGARMLADMGIALVPTLSARSERAVAHRRAAGSPAQVIAKFEAIQREGDAAFQRALAAGVMIAMGTDTGRGLREYFGKNAYELAEMVRAGMSPMQAIVATTRNAAVALGAEDRLGTLEPGKLADLLVVDGDPLADISVLQDLERIRLVMKGGAVVTERPRA